MEHVRRTRGGGSRYQPTGGIQAFVIDSQGRQECGCLRTLDSMNPELMAGSGEPSGQLNVAVAVCIDPIAARCFRNDDGASIPVGS